MSKESNEVEGNISQLWKPNELGHYKKLFMINQKGKGLIMNMSETLRFIDALYEGLIEFGIDVNEAKQASSLNGYQVANFGLRKGIVSGMIEEDYCQLFLPEVISPKQYDTFQKIVQHMSYFERENGEIKFRFGIVQRDNEFNDLFEDGEYRDICIEDLPNIINGVAP